MVGAAILRQLRAPDSTFKNDEILLQDRSSLDLLDAAAVNAYFAETNPTVVIVAAAKVGGIVANNSLPAEFIYENLMIQTNLIHAAYKIGAKQLLFLGSSCIYPKLAKQPIKEKELLSGALEPTNEPYAIAKIAGIKLCESYNRQYGVDYRCLMPTNLWPWGQFSSGTLSCGTRLIEAFS